MGLSFLPKFSFFISRPASSRTALNSSCECSSSGFPHARDSGLVAAFLARFQAQDGAREFGTHYRLRRVDLLNEQFSPMILKAPNPITHSRSSMWWQEF